MSTVVQGHLAKTRIDLDDTNKALRAFYGATDAQAAAERLHTATEALMRAVSTLTQVVEAQEQGQIAQQRKRDDCASHYGTYMP